MENFTRYHLNSGQRCLKLETGKAYVLKFRNRIEFIPKEYCKMHDFEDGFTRWIVEIPTWLEEKNEDLKFILELITDENKH
tara:strand:+ start:211 stop:453 length:243 start_codon:yes stop_codon:yes gene_type:complete